MDFILTNEDDTDKAFSGQVGLNLKAQSLYLIDGGHPSFCLPSDVAIWACSYWPQCQVKSSPLLTPIHSHCPGQVDNFSIFCYTIFLEICICLPGKLRVKHSPIEHDNEQLLRSESIRAVFTTRVIYDLCTGYPSQANWRGVTKAGSLRPAIRLPLVTPHPIVFNTWLYPLLYEQLAG